MDNPARANGVKPALRAELVRSVVLFRTVLELSQTGPICEVVCLQGSIEIGRVVGNLTVDVQWEVGEGS
jgi:hypothetical protein